MVNLKNWSYVNLLDHTKKRWCFIKNKFQIVQPTYFSHNVERGTGLPYPNYIAWIGRWDIKKIYFFRLLDGRVAYPAAFYLYFRSIIGQHGGSNSKQSCAYFECSSSQFFKEIRELRINSRVHVAMPGESR